MAAPQSSLTYRLVAHLVIFGLCVVMPAVVMLIMPVASTTFLRHNGTVSATSVRKVFFVIPVLTQTVSNVNGVEDHYEPGALSKTTRSGPANDAMRPATQTEAFSTLVIIGSEAFMRVPVSPADVDEVRRQVRDFLADSAQTQLRLFTVANWKISVLTGGALSLLTLVYCTCMLAGLVSKLGKWHPPVLAAGGE